MASFSALKGQMAVWDTQVVQLVWFTSAVTRSNFEETFTTFSKLNLKSKDSEAYPHNRCGQSEGLSLERVSCSDRDSLRERSADMAREDATPMGAAVAVAGDLRGKRLLAPMENTHKVAIDAAQQIAFVLADGGTSNPGHAVMRFHPATDRVIHNKIVERVLEAFIAFSAWESRCTEAEHSASEIV
jgi:hypothetical protein